MQKILILVFSNLKHDARVMRQVNFLKKNYELTVCCYDIPHSTEYKTIILPIVKLTFFRKLFSGLLLLLKVFSSAYDRIYPYQIHLGSLLANDHFDLIIANDIETLPLAFQLKKPTTKILFDAHEYAPKHFEDKFWWRVFFQPFNTSLCDTYIPKVDGMITIGQDLADEYEKNFGKKPIVINNATNYYEAKPTNADSATIKLIHHGIVTRSRRIELIIQMIDHLPKYYTLDLMLVVPGKSARQMHYLEELKEFAKKRENIQFREPVTSDKINTVLQHYDMGIILAPPINFNYSNGLPNKLYDYIQARLGVVTGPTPEIARVVTKYQIGVVADDFTSIGLAKKLSSLTRKEVQEFKENSNRIARDLSSEKNEVTLNNLVNTILTS
jgi:hypothetical protein